MTFVTFIGMVGLAVLWRLADRLARGHNPPRPDAVTESRRFFGGL